MEIIIIVVMILLLIGIFVRSGRNKRRQRGMPCPYCREPMNRKATVCASCGRGSKMYYRWSKEQPPKKSEKAIDPGTGQSDQVLNAPASSPK